METVKFLQNSQPDCSCGRTGKINTKSYQNRCIIQPLVGVRTTSKLKRTPKILITHFYTQWKLSGLMTAGFWGDTPCSRVENYLTFAVDIHWSSISTHGLLIAPMIKTVSSSESSCIDLDLCRISEKCTGIQKSSESEHYVETMQHRLTKEFATPSKTIVLSRRALEYATL